MPKIQGNGSIYQMERNKPKSKCRKWQLRVTVGKDAKTGKYPPRTRVVHGTYSEAKTAMRSFIAEIERGEFNPKSELFGDCIDIWLEVRKTKVALDTWKRDEAHIKNFKKHLANIPIQNIKPKMLEKVYEKLRNGENSSGRKLSGTYLSNGAAMLHLFFRDMIRNELLFNNPCDAARSPKRDTKERKAMRKKSMKELIENLDPTDGSQFAIRIMTKTGMRRGEVVALSIRDLDFKNKIIHAHSGTDSTGKVKVTKTPKGKRDLPMTESAAKDFRERIRYINHMFRDFREDFDLDIPVITLDTPLVCDQLGQRYRPGAITRWWNRNRGSLGLDDWTPHELRHSYLSELARSRIPAEVLRDIAGHESIETTKDIYVHVDMIDKQEAIENVDW